MANFYSYLRDGGYLTEQQLKEGLSSQSERRNSTFYSALSRKNIIPEEQLQHLAADFFGVKRITNPYRVEVDFVATEKILGNASQAIELRMFVVHLDGKLTYIVNDPENDVLRNKATTALGSEPQFAIISSEDFRVIEQYQLTPRAISEQARQIKDNVNVDTQGGVRDDSNATASYTQKLLSMMIDGALERRASDLHIQKIDDTRARVMIRVDGLMYHFTDINADILPNLRNKLKTMSEVGGETPTKPVEGQIHVNHNGVDIDIRVNIVFTVNGYDFTFRFIDSQLKSLEELGLSPENYDRFIKLLHMTKGLVILCGPTGAGKTSLLYAGFKKLVAEDKMIFTVEDPVEIKMPGITQLEVKKEQGQTYEEQLPSALRHDPDVVAVGETRTKEVGMQAIQAANTGRLLFTTLHTNDSVGTIARLTNMGIDSYTVGDVLAAVVAQRLVRRVCLECAEEYELPEKHIWRTRYDLGDGSITLKRGRGCACCGGTGYRGRIAVHEFMVVTPKLRNAIQRGATRTEIEDILKREGFKRYIEDAVEKAHEGITTFDEVDVLYGDYIAKNE